jgi:hypothetical protein
MEQQERQTDEKKKLLVREISLESVKAYIKSLDNEYTEAFRDYYEAYVKSVQAEMMVEVF